MPSTNVFNKLCVKRSLLRSLPQKVIAVCNAVYFRFTHRFDAYSSTSYSRGIRWLPSPEVCRMLFFKLQTTGIFRYNSCRNYFVLKLCRVHCSLLKRFLCHNDPYRRCCCSLRSCYLFIFGRAGMVRNFEDQRK